jgi:hypothetical protein
MSNSGVIPWGLQHRAKLLEKVPMFETTRTFVESRFPPWRHEFTQREYLAFCAKFYIQELQVPVQPDWGIRPGDICQCPEFGECKHPGKHPAIKAPRDNASRDLEQAFRWIRAGRNLSAAPLQLLVIDVEYGADKDGLTPFVHWCGMAGLDIDLMLSTFSVRSGSGGVHLYYFIQRDVVPPKGMDRWLPDVDVKTSAKVSDKITLPGSRHWSGGVYNLVDGCNWPVRAPDVLVRELRAGRAWIELPVDVQPCSGPVNLGEYISENLAWRHARLLRPGEPRPKVQRSSGHRMRGSSSWLRGA